MINMKIFAPCQGGCWGDNINNLWAAEYIKYRKPEWEIVVYDKNPDGEFYRDYLKLDWMSSTTDPYTHIAYTHHRHIINREYNIPVPKIFFDSSGIAIRFIAENWYPSFIPKDDLINQFNSLNLPEHYNVIHYSRCGYGYRTSQSFENFSNRYQRLTNLLPTISTGRGNMMPNTIDMGNLPSMLKLYVMIKANNIFVSHSGFTQIAAMYRRRINSFVLDSNMNSIQNQMAPPIHTYSNVEFNHNMLKAFYNMEKFSDNLNYHDYCLNNETCTILSFDKPIPNQFMQFPDVPIQPDVTYLPQSIYLEKENCPVADLEITKIYDI